MLIFRSLCERDLYQLDESACASARALLQRMYDERGASFGNGRAVRTFFERTVERQAVRLGSDAEADPACLLAEDFPG